MKEIRNWLEIGSKIVCKDGGVLANQRITIENSRVRFEFDWQRPYKVECRCVALFKMGGYKEQNLVVLHKDNELVKEIWFREGEEEMAVRGIYEHVDGDWNSVRGAAIGKTTGIT